MIGFTDPKFILRINISIACWSLFCGVVVSLLVVKIRRRVMYLVCTCSLLLCYIAWTISMERAQTAKNSGLINNAANIAVLFFIYAYSPCYNMGYNALTYSEWPGPSCAKLNPPGANPPQPTWSKSGLMPSVPAVSPCSSSLAVSPASSPPLSTPSASRAPAGSTSSPTAAGSALKFASSTSCSPRPSAAPWKNLPSVR